MAIALFSQVLGHFSAERASFLHSRFGVEAVYALVWPDYTGDVEPHPQNNRASFDAWRRRSGRPLWAWIVCSADQVADAHAIARLERELNPDGYLLNIEKPLEGAKLGTLVNAVKATGRPARASLAGFSPSATPYDYRALDLAGIAMDWQAYIDSGEGPRPDVAVAELYQSSFVVEGWEYRHRIGSAYGWGRVTSVQEGELAAFDSYLQPKSENAVFGVLPREWGWSVDDRVLWPLNPDKPPSGLLMGRAPYAKIRITLDVTRSASARPAAAWTEIAASARVPGASKRPISVYLAESTSDDVLAAIAAGAA